MEAITLHHSAPEAVSLLKAMANERRLLILCYLLEGELSVGTMSDRLDLSQSALSQHLAWLRRDGLVATRKESQTVYYRLKSQEVKSMIELLQQMYCP
ncbi:MULTISPECIES: helix-turn-helix transcriptional regulator [unclassified Photobacterium]|uniref:ArsR/SmtB family transcription factor n=1 Tax=unclassified Photobacterium TaxID=2628852 RepID=UPI001B8C2070|nr:MULTISPECIES: metalloregulator ArsR/SmtB family transcription factor [unclassified Photobacterium]MDO6704775.1 metalloregulator ArsR/SmtB family transcription factor [Photobacterium sp. 1_MG-2023]QUJ68003.1 winged helix-turn-helix transcriptional regulator [Photobacterium sp. GJ3]